MMMRSIDRDGAILAAWERRQRAFAAYRALPLDNRPVIAGYGPGERELWAEIDAAEEEIRSATAHTTRGVMIQLQCAVFHSLTQQSDVEAFERGDIAAIEAGEHGPETWSERLALAALRSLIAMEAEQCWHPFRDAFPNSILPHGLPHWFRSAVAMPSRQAASSGLSSRTAQPMN